MIFKTNMCLLLVMWLCDAHRVAGNVVYNNSSPDTTELNEIMEIQPYFTKPELLPSNLIAKPSGNMFRFQCIVQGSPEPTITWTKDNNVIIRELGNVQYRKYAIIMQELVPNDTGNYTCKACNVIGCIEHSTNLVVIDRVTALPIIQLGYPKNVTVFVGDTAELECPAIFDLMVYIEWFKFNLQNNSYGQILNLVIESNILRLENVTYEDEGWYTCYEIYSLGSSEAPEKTYLTVVEPNSPVNPIKLPMHGLPMHGLPIWLLIIIIILVTIFIIGIGIVYAFFKKSQTEKRNKIIRLEKEAMMTKYYYQTGEKYYD